MNVEDGLWNKNFHTNITIGMLLGCVNVEDRLWTKKFPTNLTKVMLNGRVNVKNGFRNRNITTTKSLIQVAKALKGKLVRAIWKVRIVL